MEFIIRVETKSMINWLSFFGYYISKLLWYFFFDVVYCCICRPREQQAGQHSAMMTNGVTNHHRSQDMMIVGTKSVTENINKAVYTQRSVLNTTNSDDSDYDGDDESSEDDTDYEMGINSAKKKLEYHGRHSDDAREERFEMASEQREVTTAKPSKPKKTKSKKKKSKPKTKKRSKPSQMKEKKPKGNGAMTKQCMMGTVTDDIVKWDEGTNQQHHHPVKRPHNKRLAAATADEGSCTTSCVQCCDTD